MEINTDSQVVVDGATKWCKVWSQNGWRSDFDGGQIKNIPEWKELIEAMKDIDCKFVRLINIFMYLHLLINKPVNFFY